MCPQPGFNAVCEKQERYVPKRAASVTGKVQMLSLHRHQRVTCYPDAPMWMGMGAAVTSTTAKLQGIRGNTSL